VDNLIIVGNNSDIDELLEKTDPPENGKKHNGVMH